MSAEDIERDAVDVKWNTYNKMLGADADELVELFRFFPEDIAIQHMGWEDALDDDLCELLSEYPLHEFEKLSLHPDLPDNIQMAVMKLMDADDLPSEFREKREAYERILSKETVNEAIVKRYTERVLDGRIKVTKQQLETMVKKLLEE